MINDVIINPNNLKVEGWFATDLGNKKRVILLSQDVREILTQGFVVNDHDALTPRDELVRLNDLLKHEFTLIGKQVVTTSKQKLGKVGDYAFEKNAFFIQKLYVSQSIIKSFTGGSLVIDRTQIVEISHKRITVSDATIKEQAPMPATA